MGSDVQGYQAYLARVDTLLGMLDVVWPDFIEQDGLVLRRSATPQDWEVFKAEAAAAHWSETDMEYVINHLHIPDLFLNDPDRDTTDEAVYVFLADTIADMWQCRLQRLYPEKSFAVGVANRETDPEVFAHLIRSE
jgi:hypothetical protein